jgi:SpoVK/Ycf46/Vps4 family AAA+-type ATPase
MRKNKQRPLLFFDEAEALFGSRVAFSKQYAGFSAVPSFLAEMYGLYAEKPLVVLASNLPESIDPAVLRDGRVDIKLHIGRPDREEFKEMVTIHLRNKLCADSKITLAEFATEKIFSCVLYHNVSGAMAATLSNLSTKEAIMRRIKNRTAAKGVVKEDIETAINNMLQEK